MRATPRPKPYPYLISHQTGIFCCHFLRLYAQRIAWLAGCSLLVTAAYAANVIQIENAKPGTPDWQLTNPATNREIEGYASLTSVSRGGRISLFVNTAEPTYIVEIFRMGWYGGLGGRRMTSAIQLLGTSQVIPSPDAATGLAECAWINPYVLTIPDNPADPTDWASGAYLARLTAGMSGKQSYIIFIVRDDARLSDYLFESSVTTYQAYNNWGGKSLYPFNSTNEQRAYKVSFNRPYSMSSILAAAYGMGAGDYFTNGTGSDYPGSKAGWECNMVRWLEKEGYDVTYCTNLDVHENLYLLLSHKAFLSVGHNEYWSWEMRSNVTAARDQGVSLGFFSANTCYWQIRLEPSTSVDATPDRTMVCYKDETIDPYYLDPSTNYLVTVRWRDYPVNMPEDAFMGVMYENDPVEADIVVTDASSWVFATTGLNNGDHLGGLLGYEVDRVFGNAPAGTQVLAHSPYVYDGSPFYSDMTVYTAASGATVFADGTVQWAWGLDDYNVPLRTSRLNRTAQQITRNLLARFINDQPPLANAGGPYTGTASQAVQFDGSASSDPDGVITAWEWDFGDGTTSTDEMPVHTYNMAGTYTVTVVVTDNQGSRNAAFTSATIGGQGQPGETRDSSSGCKRSKRIFFWRRSQCLRSSHRPAQTRGTEKLEAYNAESVFRFADSVSGSLQKPLQ